MHETSRPFSNDPEPLFPAPNRSATPWPSVAVWPSAAPGLKAASSTTPAPASSSGSQSTDWFSSTFLPLQAQPLRQLEDTRRWHDGIVDASQKIKEATASDTALMNEALNQTKQAMQNLDRLTAQQHSHAAFRNAVASSTQTAAERQYEATLAKKQFDIAIGKNALGVRNEDEVQSAKAEADQKTMLAQEAFAQSVQARANAKASEHLMLAAKMSVRSSLESARSATGIALHSGTAAPDLVRAHRSLDEVLNHNYKDLDQLWPVERDCTFLNSNVVLGTLKKTGAGSDAVCNGLVASVASGHPDLARVQCAPRNNGTCPTQFDPLTCQVKSIHIDDTMIGM